MAPPGRWRCPRRCPSALPVALLVAVTCLLQGSLLGAALGAAGVWWALRSRRAAMRLLPLRSPPRWLLPRRSPPLRLPPYRPRPSLIARIPTPEDLLVWHLRRQMASNSASATVSGRGLSASTRGNRLGAPPQTARHRHPLPQDRSPEDIFVPKKMCMRESPQSGKGSCCEALLWIGRQWELRLWEDSAPGKANKAVQPEEAVQRPEEERRQSPSPPPSPGKGRPRRRSICLLVPGEIHPLVLFPELNPEYPTAEMILEEEGEEAWQCFRRLLAAKAASPQSCSGTSRTQAAKSTASVASGQAVSSASGLNHTSGLTDTSQPRSGSAPVLPGTPAPISGQRPSGFGRAAASSGSSTRTRCQDRARKRHKEEDRRDAKWPFAPPEAKRRRL